MSGTAITVLVTTYLASTVEAVEMVVIVVGVGATRGWRSTWLGVAGGLAVLAAIVAVFGLALSAVPIGPLRLVIGALLLAFGLQWLRKGIRRVAVYGFAGLRVTATEDDEEAWTGEGVDWTAAVLAFKGVLLEGLEIAFIVVSVGVAAGELGTATIGGASALVITALVGAALGTVVRRVPRSVLQLIVGVMLTTFGTFWALEGLGVAWPAGDGTIPILLVLYGLVALAYITLERRRAFGLSPSV
jgi:Ca2+/H+ antiporter, TMEM165/GDT1 family